MSSSLLIVTAVFSLIASILSGWVLLSHRKEIFTRERIRQRWQGKPMWQVVGMIILVPVALVGGWMAGQHGPELLFRFLTPVLLVFSAMFVLRNLKRTD